MQKKHSRVLILILLSLIPGLVFLFREGLYWDDWSQLFCFEKFGAESFWEYFVYDRPSSTWTDILYFSFIGDSPVCWHLFFLGLKTAVTLLFDLLMRRLFPDRGDMTCAASILLALCPIFSSSISRSPIHSITPISVCDFCCSSCSCGRRIPHRF